ncbi:MAG: 50S ribosomal protein L17 [Thermoflavifilum sp.]|nr:50S ribosomal protein L17 [Thermoflavifilum sp.]
MRHGVKINHLGRTKEHRQALLSNLACQLIQHKRIITTLAKARALRQFVEPLLTKAKSDTMHNRRLVFSYLHHKEATKELFDVVAEKIAHRPGGYTRIIKLGTRPGDAAEQALIELVDFNEWYNKPQASQKTTTTKRTRRGGRKKSSAAQSAEPAASPAGEGNENTKQQATAQA